jgi:Flp pilus assembly protein TadG
MPRAFASLWVPLVRCQKGNSIVLTGFVLFGLVGFAGLAVDGAQWVLWKRQLQRAADSGATAGVMGLRQGGQGMREADRAARRTLALNGERAFTIVAVETPPTSGPLIGDNDSVRVILETSQALPFSSLFLSSAPIIRVTATAQRTGSDPVCVLAMETGTQTALSVSGSSSVSMGCGLMSNSPNSPSAAFGSSPVDVSSIAAVGTIAWGSGIRAGTPLRPGSGAMADPFASVPNPNLSACAGASDYKISSGRTATIGPGCYHHIDIGGNVTFLPGVYYLNEGDFTVQAGATVTGSGVTFVFSSSDTNFNGDQVGRTRFNGSSNLNLTAPDTGPYAGILFYQDRRTRLTSATDMFIAGNNGSLLRGAIYAPGAQLRFTGNSSINTDCVQMIGRRVEFTGNSQIRNQCPNGSASGAFGGGNRVRLVE